MVCKTFYYMLIKFYWLKILASVGKSVWTIVISITYQTLATMFISVSKKDYFKVITMIAVFVVYS